MIVPYNPHLKKNSRNLRSNQTNAELLLWSHLRRKQICEVQFYRQKPIGNYIVDFYAPSVKLAIEVDGSQHFEKRRLQYDKKRENDLAEFSVKVLRFDNLEVLMSLQSVLEVIYKDIVQRQSSKSEC